MMTNGATSKKLQETYASHLGATLPHNRSYVNKINKINHIRRNESERRRTVPGAGHKADRGATRVAPGGFTGSRPSNAQIKLR